MWKELRTQHEIDNFMKEIIGFHDSCIKEIKYSSGAYVETNLSMSPVNTKRTLTVLIQRQFEDISALELEFSELEYISMYPVKQDYTCEILDASFFVKDGLIYWCDNGDVNEDDIHNYKGTVICSKKFVGEMQASLSAKEIFIKVQTNSRKQFKSNEVFAPLLFLLTYKIIKRFLCYIRYYSLHFRTGICVSRPVNAAFTVLFRHT